MKVNREYIDEFHSAFIKYLSKYAMPKDKYLAKQLLFMGWVEEDSFQRDSDFAYFVTNRRLDGKYYIYPQKFSDNYTTQNQAKSYSPYIGLIGIPGLTKVEYSLRWKK